VTSGTCHAVVTATGTGTEIGRVNAGVLDAQSMQHRTPLQEQVDRFVGQLSGLISIICVGVWVASIPKFGSSAFRSWWQGAAHYSKVAVALGVAAIPEGLPAVITLCLSLGTRRMAQRNVIVRKLSSVETLGCTSVVCTDKTGTLTTNKMTVKALVTADAVAASLHERGAGSTDLHLVERAVEGVSYDPVGQIAGIEQGSWQSPALRMLASVCVMCNEANIVYRNGTYERAGEPTEAALKVLAEKLGAPGIERTTDADLSAHQFNDYWTSQYSPLATLEFNRDRKSMSVLVRPTDAHWGGTSGNLLFVKGAAEMVAARCKYIQAEDGTLQYITDEVREQITVKLQEMARRPLRCLALAYKSGEALGELNDISTPEQAAASSLLKDASKHAVIESDLVLVGFCGIKDPARPEAADAIRRCTQAGIRVMMITGDSKDTAVAIAKDVNIFDEGVDVARHAFTGKEFFDLDEGTQLELLRTGNKVFCRTEPKDKQRLIKLLDRLGEIVAMTGDGVNDAPALQQAAIGVAMGVTGTEVAKSAADMILADDNFATIVGAVEEGRNIYANMQTFICFLISSNIGEVMAVLFATLLGLPEPLTPLHLLFVNLVTDGPAATALGFNPPDPRVMEKRPRPKDQPMMSRWLMTRYALTGLYVGFATIGAFVWWYLDKGVTLQQLCRWGDCASWPDFVHSALAPLWPKQPCGIFSGKLLARPQTMALSVLVVIEMLKALSAVSLNSSLLTVQPWQNPWLLLGVLVPTLVHMAVLYVPALSRLFGVAPLNLQEWQVSWYLRAICILRHLTVLSDI
jgi:Ca2+-transporting ATPase